MEKTRKKGKKKWIFIIAAIIVVLVFIVLNLSQSQRGTVSVQTRKVERGDITSVVSGSGTVQPRTKVNITSEVTAEVIGVPVNEGDYVTRGQKLIQLDTVQLKSDMESALYNANELDARLEGAKVLLDQYHEESDRQNRLYEKKLTSEQIYKDAYYAYKSQEANYNALMEQKRAASARLEKARDNLNKTTIRAPMNGTITLVDVEVGEIAQAQTAFTQGRTLMVISDLSAFEVEVEIDETDIAYLEPKQEADIEIDAFPDTVFEGQVAEIGNTAITSGYGTSEQSTNFRVKVSLVKSHPKIRPGMSSTVDITTNYQEDVVTVPIQAVVMRSFDADSLRQTTREKADSGESGNVAMASPLDDLKDENPETEDKIDKTGVFVVREGVAHFVEIETGIADQQNYEVLTGLSEGDEVVTGSFRTLRTIKDGTPVKVDNWERKKEEQE